MEINPATITTITFGELEEVRGVLLSAQTFHQARDISDHAALLASEVKYRPLTREIDRVLKHVEGLISDCLMAVLDQEDEPDEVELEEGEYAEEDSTVDEFKVDGELAEELSAEPLGTIREIKPVRGFEWEEEK